MASTQDDVPISDIEQDVVILKDGSMAIVMETSAVNFGLLSENEQLAIISAFAGLLNSLSFPIQIVIRSKRLDISSYLIKLDLAKRKQTNPLLIRMIENYSEFIRNTIAENQVLDKQFFIVVPLSYLELGIGKRSAETFKKAMTILIPRRDHLIRQFSGIGLRITQLSSERLVKLFYDIYNEVDLPTLAEQPATPGAAVAPTRAQPAQQTQPTFAPAPIPQSMPMNTPTQPEPLSNVPRLVPTPQPSATPVVDRPVSPAIRSNRPFVVEELPDEYTHV